MIYPELCYKKISESKVILNYFEQNKDNLTFEKYYGFDVSTIPLSLAFEEPVLGELHLKHKIKGAGIIRLQPYRCYKWHQDAVRGVSINMLLSHSESMVLFGNSSTDSEDQLDVIRLEYDIGHLYAFDTQSMHTVINLDKPRYLFTVEFEEDKHQFKYSDLINAL